MGSLSAAAALIACVLPAGLAAREGAPHTAPNMDAHSMHLAERTIRVRDLARLSPDEERRFGALPVAWMPDGRSTLDLNAERRAALLRRRVPGHPFPLLVEGPARFVAPPAATMGRTGRACFALRHNLAAGGYVTEDTVSVVPCQPTVPVSLSLRFDPAVGATRADAPLDAGVYLGPLALRHGGIVEQGSSLTLAIAAGPVRIERHVGAMQPARSGRSLFVRTAEGAILAAPLATGADR